MARPTSRRRDALETGARFGALWQPMRPLLAADHTSPDAARFISSFHADVVRDVSAAVARDGVVVVGMAQNPHVRKTRKALDEAGVAFTYSSTAATSPSGSGASPSSCGAAGPPSRRSSCAGRCSAARTPPLPRWPTARSNNGSSARFADCRLDELTRPLIEQWRELRHEHGRDVHRRAAQLTRAARGAALFWQLPLGRRFFVLSSTDGAAAISAPKKDVGALAFASPELGHLLPGPMQRARQPPATWIA